MFLGYQAQHGHIDAQSTGTFSRITASNIDMITLTDISHTTVKFLPPFYSKRGGQTYGDDDIGRRPAHGSNIAEADCY